MHVDLYNKILHYSDKRSLGGSTKGHRVLTAIEEMYERVNADNFDNVVILNEENRKVLNSFQNFGLLTNQSLSEAVNEAIKVYIKDHKEHLQQKISEL